MLRSSSRIWLRLKHGPRFQSQTKPLFSNVRCANSQCVMRHRPCFLETLSLHISPLNPPSNSESRLGSSLKMDTNIEENCDRGKYELERIIDQGKNSTTPFLRTRGGSRDGIDAIRTLRVDACCSHHISCTPGLSMVCVSSFFQQKQRALDGAAFARAKAAIKTETCKRERCACVSVKELEQCCRLLCSVCPTARDEKIEHTRVCMVEECV